MRNNFQYLAGLMLVFLVTSCSNSEKSKSDIGRQQALRNDWQIFSAANNTMAGNEISSRGFVAKKAIDAQVPTTVFNAQVQQGVFKDVYMGMNLETISSIPYKLPWWYRKEFDLTSIKGNGELQFDGINYKANIWLNGVLIADTSIINNAFKRYRFDVSTELKEGVNIMAVEVFPPKAGDYTIGFVDWNPAPPDENMGIFRSVVLNIIDKVQIVEPYIENYFADGDYSKASQTVSLKLKNFTNTPVEGVLEVDINGKTISKEVVIDAAGVEKIILNTKDFPELIVENPQLWWPHTIGEPVLHQAAFRFIEKNIELAHADLQYGIREVKDYFTADGHKGFLVNGEKISIRGGGWVDNMMLDNTEAYDLAQLEYVKSMNLNTIRLEGFWGKNEHIYKTCDELGILVMVGWSCHWEWENYLGTYCDEKYGGILEDDDVQLVSEAWEDQIIWLRNHPSIMVWFSGSDCVPTPALEEKYALTFNAYDSSRIYLSSAKEWESGDIQTGAKMRGPYAYVPPVYWYSDTLYGGAFGFNTETGPGAQVPPLESILKMIPKGDLWPINEVWDFHCGRNEFNSLDRYNTAMDARYGKSASVEEYAHKAQLLNYELMRPMFEAFSANRYEATAVIQWMLNSAWPEMYWQLYDSYLMPNAAFYATKKAGEPLHALYNYDTDEVYLVNDRLVPEEDINIEIKVFDLNSKLLYKNTITTNISKNTSNKIMDLSPYLKFKTKVLFLDIRIIKEDKEIANNFYWLSKKADILDYEAEVPNWYFHTPSKEYADFTSLKEMKKVSVQHSMTIQRGGEFTTFTINADNATEGIAFFMEYRIIDKITQESILPVLWDDNYISLLPFEKRVLTAKIRNEYLGDMQVELIVSGNNTINNKKYKSQIK
ncbi:MAG: glycoside hydrolase family 2 [Bacteroidales bacterium]|nr:glycoside hydrolase family 2 [Bacteroidales bacterium]